MISNFEDHDHQPSEKALSPSHKRHDVRNPYDEQELMFGQEFDVANGMNVLHRSTTIL